MSGRVPHIQASGLARPPLVPSPDLDPVLSTRVCCRGPTVRLMAGITPGVFGENETVVGVMSDSWERLGEHVCVPDHFCKIIYGSAVLKSVVKTWPRVVLWAAGGASPTSMK